MLRFRRSGRVAEEPTAFGPTGADGAVTLREAIRELGMLLGCDVEAISRELSLQRVKNDVADGARNLGIGPMPIPLEYNSDTTLAEFCYIGCRALRPDVVIETGVAYGATTSYLLAALAENGKGVLHSIDMAPLVPGADRFVGYLVPQRLRSQWVLHRRATQRYLPTLMKRLARVDMFLHDSEHSFTTMLFELNQVAPYLSEGGLVVADDVDCNGAWSAWVRRWGWAFSRRVHQVTKESAFGFLCGKREDTRR